MINFVNNNKFCIFSALFPDRHTIVLGRYDVGDGGFSNGYHSACPLSTSHHCIDTGLRFVKQPLCVSQAMEYTCCFQVFWYWYLGDWYSSEFGWFYISFDYHEIIFVMGHHFQALWHCFSAVMTWSFAVLTSFYKDSDIVFNCRRFMFSIVYFILSCWCQQCLLHFWQFLLSLRFFAALTFFCSVVNSFYQDEI